ncbi:MAG: hypothetical protein JSS49_13650 [Planctomycetes bacterium]|nr:hypothetical protein [Planctomycetota bacterium]
MTRNAFITATISVVLSAVMLPSTRADELDPFGAELQTPPLNVPAPLSYDEPSAQPTSSYEPVSPQTAIFRQTADGAAQTAPMPVNPEAYAVPQQVPGSQPGYVRLGAPMYPSPRPNIPIWSGATMITSPALAPHEMLYPHTYRSTNAPFYHRVKGGWILTPFGVRSHEKWELQGTQVTVKYRSQPPLWTSGMWFPPRSSSGSAFRY